MPVETLHHILLVTEDDETVRQVQHILPSMYFILNTVSSQHEALERLAHHTFDAVITTGSLLDRATINWPVIAYTSDHDHLIQSLAQALDLPLATFASSELLFEATQAIVEVVDLDTVLHRAISAAIRLTHANHAVILLEENGHLNAHAGEITDFDPTVSRDVFESGHSARQRANVYAPITHQRQTLGVLAVSRNADCTPYHQRVLEQLASITGSSIHNARVHQANRDRMHDLERLLTTSQILNTNMPLNEAFINICAQLAVFLDVDSVFIYEWTGQHLRNSARYYRAKWETGPPVDPDHMHKAATWIDSPEPGIACILVLPVQTDILLRCYYTRQPHVDIRLDRIETSSSTSSDNLLCWLEDTTEKLHADWCDLAIDATSRVRSGQAVWLANPAPGIDLAQHPDLHHSLERHDIVTETTVLMDATDSETILGIPLVQRGSVKGLVVFARTDSSFNQREIDLGRAAVGQAAIALENLSLVHDLEQTVTSLRKTQDRLVQTARLSAMGELAGVIAHQINNPLTTIIVDTELMLLDEPADSPRYAALQAIARTGKRAANVARRLLAIARPVDPNASPDFINVVDSLRSIISLLQAHIEHANITLELDLPDTHPPPVLTTKGQIEDIWINLLINAYDALANRGNGHIGVKVQHLAETQQVSVSICDNGPGIPEEIQEQIFSPFFTTKPVGEGTGLGLHISREVAEAAGGTISVHSIPDKITRFTVLLPVTDETTMTKGE
jgi:signal transduction histidine kinase